MRTVSSRICERDLEKLKKLLKNLKEVQFYKYRTATVKDIIFEFKDYSKISEMEEIKNMLYKIVNKKEDNHVVFAIELESGAKLYILTKDFDFIVGLSINETNW